MKLNFSTLVDLLGHRAAELPDKCLYTYLADGETDERNLTYRDLEIRVKALAAKLQAANCRGERAVLIYPPGLDFIVAFFACLHAGVIAVPTYPPDPGRIQRTLPRLQGIVRDSGARFLLTTEVIREMAQPFLEQCDGMESLEWLGTDEIDPNLWSDWRDPGIGGDQLAFLQYTSGSTGNPKGVMLSHANLLHNLECIRQCFGMEPESTGVLWLPPYHDMGLIGGILGPLYGGCATTLISPIDFLKKPLRWLKAISRTRGSINGGPNFVYDLCVRSVTAEERKDLDLSCWRLAFNGAEPIRAETLDRFCEAFGPQGFRREAFYPCYGLAEATLIVSGNLQGRGPRISQVSKEALHRHRAMSVEPHADLDCRASLVACGGPAPGQEIRVVDPETLEECFAGRIGEIWISGPSVAKGYWGQEELSRNCFQAQTATGEGPFLRSGDLGYLDGGDLFVTGRIKDVMIFSGRNHYPQDIERIVESSHEALRRGCVAAFSVEEKGEERLVVVAELKKGYLTEQSGAERVMGGSGSTTERQEAILDQASIQLSVRQAIQREMNLAVHEVVLIRSGSIPKTSSGKIMRWGCRKDYLSGQLEKP